MYAKDSSNVGRIRQLFSTQVYAGKFLMVYLKQQTPWWKQIHIN